MYGYICCNKSGLSEDEIDRYQSVYCGLCNNLKTRYGQLERISLSYDMTFVILFLSSLYEPEEEAREFRCGVHPLHKKTETENKFTAYAADMTIALSYYKCMDDWKDEKKYLKRLYAESIKKQYQEVGEKYPRQCKAISEGIRELEQIENSTADTKPDEAVKCSGKMLSELFVYEEDFWSNSLRSFGFELGKFIYLMDASMDYKEDIRKHNYNPLIGMNKKPEEMKEILTMCIGNVTQIFEKLPLVQDQHLLRNILYGGVWQKYSEKMQRKEKKHG